MNCSISRGERNPRPHLRLLFAMLSWMGIEVHDPPAAMLHGNRSLIYLGACIIAGLGLAEYYFVCGKWGRVECYESAF
jgi:hypothetical protein